MRPSRHGNGAAPARAWIDDAHAEWDREAASYGPDDDDDGDGETDDTPTPIVIVTPWGPDDGPAWLTLRQHEAWDTLSEMYPHAELVDGPAVRVGGVDAEEYHRATASVLWGRLPLSLPVWQSVFAEPVRVEIDLRPLA